MSRMTFMALSAAATKSCGVRACSKASGVSIPNESLGPGQKQEIDRVCAAYPHLNDDAFVRANVARWLA